MYRYPTQSRTCRPTVTANATQNLACFQKPPIQRKDLKDVQARAKKPCSSNPPPIISCPRWRATMSNATSSASTTGPTTRKTMLKVIIALRGKTMRACPNTAHAVSDVLRYITELTVKVHWRPTLVPVHGFRAQQRAAHALRRLHHGPQGPHAAVRILYRIVLRVVAAPALVERQVRAIHPAAVDVD